MVKMTIFYPYEEGKYFDFDYYATKHMALVNEKVGEALVSVSVDKGLGGPGPGMPPVYMAMGNLYLKSAEDVATYVAPNSPAFDADLPNFTDITPVIQISEIVLP